MSTSSHSSGPQRIGIVKDALSPSLGAKAYFDGIKSLVAENQKFLETEHFQFFVIDVASRQVTSLMTGQEIEVRGVHLLGIKHGNFAFNDFSRRLQGKLWLAFIARSLRLTTLFPAPFSLSLLYRTQTLLHWIPDFQHVHLPEFFTPEELKRRNRAFRTALKSERRVLLSSQSSFEDAKAWVPNMRAQVKIAQPRFPLINHENSGALTQLSPAVPPKYFYCPSQWWPHKGIEEILLAMKEVSLTFPDVRIVFTGLDPKNPYPESSRRSVELIETLRLSDNCVLYPPMHHSAQRQLMGDSHAVIQASHFEGWNLGVSEGAQLGKSLIISDLQIHREQLGQYPARWFTPGSWKELSNLLVNEWVGNGKAAQFEPIHCDPRISWAPFRQAFTTHD